ncbi:MAG: ABC transporter ATP-binding protein [Planctomycetia bacterium]|nr:ABC transporter ATP-binding protein [Planctomycetia bacterium]
MIAPNLAILARGVCKEFGSGPQRTPVLQGAGLGIARGEVVFLVGPSGSGKTTLLSILGCILTPDGGSVQVLNQEVAQLRPAELAAFRQRHLGYVFQTFNLFPTLSALDNVALAATMRGVALPTARAQAERLLEQVGLSRQGRLRPGQLSTGGCQRVAVARGLVNDPAILFADEPTASLDAANGQAVMELLTRLVKAHGVTLVVVTHDSRILSFANRILHLEHGRLIRATQPGEAAQRATLESVA